MTAKKPLVLSLALGASLLFAPLTLAVDDRPADEIIAEINAVEMPSYDRERDQAEEGYRAEYLRLRNEANQSKSELIAELYETYPTNPELVKLLPQRWGAMRGPDGMAVLEEVQAILNDPESSEDFKSLAAFWNAQVAQTVYGWSDDPDHAKVAIAINDFVKSYPEDTRSAGLLSSLAGYFTEDPKDAAKIWKRLLTDYPDDRGAKYWPGKLRQSEQLGKPFELTFTDAISGTEISMDQLKGKVVVLDFWATWCGPCIAEMPEMKELYAEFKDQGVEFLGISLDQPEDKGGLDKLKAYCAENDIPWPQYYQGDYWSSEYSVSWGINSIPAMFVVDQKGNLHSVNARGKLDKLIPELLGHDKSPGG